MKKSKWVIEVDGYAGYTVYKGTRDPFYKPTIYLRDKPLCRVEVPTRYTRPDSALRGARRMAKALGIDAEVE